MSHLESYNNVYCNCLKKKYGRNPFNSDIFNSTNFNDANLNTLVENKKRMIGTHSNTSNNIQLSTVILKGRGKSILVKNENAETTNTCASSSFKYNKF
jgi:hypothetical protein